MSDQEPIDTIEHAAIIVAGFVRQGRISQVRADDEDARISLAHLVKLVKRDEPNVVYSNEVH